MLTLRNMYDIINLIIHSGVMMIKRTWLALLSCAGLLYMLCACGDSAEQKRLNEQHIANAKKNAQNYIIEKYGFTPEIKDAVLEREYLWIGSSPLTTVFVRMEYEGKSFGVYIDGGTANTDGYDNYQAEEIQEALRAECEAMLPGVRHIFMDSNEVDTAYDSIEDECINMHHQYFDGTNVAEILSAAPSKFRVCYVNADFSAIPADCPLNAYCNDNYGSFTLISYRSEGDLQIGLKHGSEPFHSPVYADACYFVSSEGTQLQEYEIGTYDDFYYYVEDGKPSDVTFRKTTPDAPDNWSGSDQYEIFIASDAYAVSTKNDCTIQIYYPTNLIQNYDGYTTNFALCRKKDGEMKYTSSGISDTDAPYQEEDFYLSADEECYFLFLDFQRKNTP